MMNSGNMLVTKLLFLGIQDTDSN